MDIFNALRFVGDCMLAKKQLSQVFLVPLCAVLCTATVHVELLFGFTDKLSVDRFGHLFSIIHIAVWAVMIYVKIDLQVPVWTVRSPLIPMLLVYEVK